MRQVPLALVAIVVLGQFVTAQPAQRTASIAGRVTTIDRAPLPRAMRVAAVPVPETRTDSSNANTSVAVEGDGSFVIDGVVGDRVIRVTGLPVGWEIDRVVAAGNRASNPLRLAVGERVEIIVIVGRVSIRGRVTTPEGLPLRNARVTATPVTDVVNAEGADTISASALTMPARVDESGEFALKGLPDGLYLIHASVVPERDPKSGLLLPGDSEFQPTFYPGGGQDEAIAVRVGGDEAVSGITIPVTRRNLLTVAGQILRTASDTRIDAHVLAHGSADQALPLSSDGHFTMSGLKPGRYALWARAATESGFEAAWQLLDVSSDTSGVQLSMAPTAIVSGRIVTADGEPLAVDGLHVAAAWTNRGEDVDVVWRDQVAVTDSGEFQLDGLFGERSIHLVGLPDRWTVARIVSGDQQAETITLTPSAHVHLTIVIARR